MAANATGPLLDRKPRSIIAVTANRPFVVNRMELLLDSLAARPWRPKRDEKRSNPERFCQV
jgi:hypothetical protein